MKVSFYSLLCILTIQIFLYLKKKLFKFKDTQGEVSRLHKDVFPKLREFSMSRYGLEFQVTVKHISSIFQFFFYFNFDIFKAVDLSWGVHKNRNLNNEPENILEIFEKELEKCQEFSMGMNFFVSQFILYLNYDSVT
jgi:hypothetical protein